MTEIALKLDPVAKSSIDELMKHYKVKNAAEIIKKAIAVLKIAAHVEKTHGELVARLGENETKIVVR